MTASFPKKLSNPLKIKFVQIRSELQRLFLVFSDFTKLLFVVLHVVSSRVPVFKGSVKLAQFIILITYCQNVHTNWNGFNFYTEVSNSSSATWARQCLLSLLHSQWHTTVGNNISSTSQQATMSGKHTFFFFLIPKWGRVLSRCSAGARASFFLFCWFIYVAFWLPLPAREANVQTVTGAHRPALTATL